MARTYVLDEAPRQVAWRIPYEERLNDEQLRVVQAPGGKLLVLAGAGSGKTRTLTYRVARLIESGVDPSAILLLTFTNRAAREMLQRVDELLQVDTRAFWGGTFHSIGRRILREYAPRLGYPDQFQVIDTEDAQSLMKTVIVDLPSDDSGRRFPRAETLLHILSDALNLSQTTEFILSTRYAQFWPHAERIDEAIRRYAARKVEYGVMDFDDLLFHWRRLLLEHDDVRQHYASRFQHVLVDEYQDTNTVQAEVVDMMASVHGNLMVVGDDFQSIYSFRGANFRNIIEFPQRHPDCTTWLLQRNYRSSPQIVALSNRSIQQNRLQFKKELISQETPGELPAMVRCADESTQSRFVAQRILDLREEGVALEKIAVLYRAHWQSMELQLELTRRGIPFVIRSGQRFFEQKHIKDIVAWLRYIENPRDELAFIRLMTLTEGIGTGTAQKLFLFVRAHENPLDALQSLDADKIVGKRGKAGWDTARSIMSTLWRDEVRSRAGQAVDLVRERFYDDFARRSFDNFPHRLKELDTLATFAEQKGSVASFLDELSLAGAASGKDVLSTSDPDEHVILSSVHQAKGLEFHAVFVLWLADDRFPTARALESNEDMEEERRLFYVATTRAQRELYLTSPMMSFDRREGNIALRLSRFIDEVSGQPPVYERWNLVAAK